MKKTAEWLSNFSNLINKGAKYFVFCLMIFLVVIVFTEVIARYLFNTSLRYTEEIVIYSMVWLGLIGAGIAVKENTLISISSLLQSFSPKIAKFIKIIGNLMIIILLFWIVKSGINYTLRNINQLSPTMQISMMYPYLSIPVGCSILMLHYIDSVFMILFKKEKLQLNPKYDEIVH